MASREYETIVAQMRSAPPADLTLSPQVLRANMEAAMAGYPVPERTAITAVNADGTSAEWLVAENADPSRRVLYLHGGGYFYGNLDTHRGLAAAYSRASGCAVLALDYRLAPEHPYPAAVEDALTAYRWLRAHGPLGPAAASTIGIVGDSAGGGLTLATLLALRDGDEPLPDAAVTVSAWTDLAGTGESWTTRAAADPRVRRDVLDQMARWYLGDADPTNPLASPWYADLAGLPPLLMQVGGAEVLLDDTRRVAAKARAAGVEVTEEVWPEMYHVWHHRWAEHPEGQAAIERIGEYLQAHVAVSS
jgi:acetyl esterase/lipase